MLCEDVFRQITHSKEEADLYVPVTQSNFMGVLPLHPLPNWDVAGLTTLLRSTNTNTHKHFLFYIHSVVGFILSIPAP